MSINLGQVAAIVTRTSLPATELNAIIRLVDGSDNLLDFYQWDPSSTSWIAFSTLFAAVHLGATTPAKTEKLWIDNSSSPIIYKVYNGTNWVPIAATHVGTSAPASTHQIWLDSSYTPYRPKTYNASSEQWEFVFQPQHRIENADFTLSTADNQTIIDIDAGNDDVIINIVDIELTQFLTTIARLHAGNVYLQASGVTINGQTGTFTLQHQFTQVVIRRYAPSQYIISGNLI